MDDIKLTKLAKCAGCGAKVGAGTLAKLLEDIKVHNDPNLLVGFDKSDDASVYKISDDIAVVQTVRLPRKSLAPNKIQTSGTTALPSMVAAAISKAAIRFSRPSVRMVPIGSCEPVKTTGLVRLFSMKLRAAAE